MSQFRYPAPQPSTLPNASEVAAILAVPQGGSRNDLLGIEHLDTVAIARMDLVRHSQRLPEPAQHGRLIGDSDEDGAPATNGDATGDEEVRTFAGPLVSCPFAPIHRPS
jgi:hypothetical protein